MHEIKLSQLLQTNIKQFKLAVTFLTGYNGIFNVTSWNIKFIFVSLFEGAGSNVAAFRPAGNEIESLNRKIERSIFDGRYIVEKDYPFSMKPNFSNLCSVKEIEFGKGCGISVLFKMIPSEIFEA